MNQGQPPRPRCARPWGQSLIVLLAAGCAGTGVVDREMAEVVGPETHAIVRVVDAATGAPIPGVRISAYEESAHPMPGAWKARSVADTGPGGWALVPNQGGGWTYFEADGYGPLGKKGLPDTVALARGRDVTLLVLDPFGRPLPGATVEYFLGCGHTPEVRSPVTGADGRALLRCVSPKEGSLWVRAEGVAGYEFLGVLPAGSEPFVIRCRPAPTVEGTILAADGAPAAGVAVGTYDLHRGPWTRTDGEGRFRLVGAKAWEQVLVEPGEHPVGTKESVPNVRLEAAPGVPRTVRLPRDLFRQDEEAEATSPVVVRVAAAADGRLLPEVPVDFVRESDGLAYRSDTGAEGNRTIDLPAGSWRVTAGAATGPWAPAAGTTEGVLALRPNPTRKVRLPGDGDLFVVTAEERVAATPVAGEEGTWFVPAVGPAALEYEGEGGVSTLLLAEGDGPVEFPPPSPLRPITFTERPAREPLPPASLRVLLPDGRPAGGVEVRTAGGDTTVLPEDGRDDEPGFGLHDDVEVTVPGNPTLVPLRARIEGPGPWTFRWPDTTLEIRGPEEFRVYAGGGIVDGHGGVAVARGLPPGPCRSVVAAPGLRARDLRFDLREGERLVVEVRLRP